MRESTDIAIIRIKIELVKGIAVMNHWNPSESTGVKQTQAGGRAS